MINIKFFFFSLLSECFFFLTFFIFNIFSQDIKVINFFKKRVVLLLWLDSPLIQTPRAVLFIIQSIKTVVAMAKGRVWDPFFQVKKNKNEETDRERERG